MDNIIMRNSLQGTDAYVFNIVVAGKAQEAHEKISSDTQTK